MKKRILSALLAVCLVVGMVPATLLTASAAEVSGAVEITGLPNNTIKAGQPGITDTAGIEVKIGNQSVRVSSIRSYNSADGTKKGSTASTFAADQYPMVELVVASETGDTFGTISGGVTATGWNSISTTSNASSCTLLLAATQKPTPHSQTISYTEDGSGTVKTSFSNITLAVGQEYKFKPSSEYEAWSGAKANGPTLEVSTSNNAVTVNGSSTKTNVTQGNTVTIKGSKVGSTTVTVKAPAVAGLLSEATLTFTVDVIEASTLTLSGPGGTSSSTVTWAVGGVSVPLTVSVNKGTAPQSYSWVSSNEDIVKFQNAVAASPRSLNVMAVGTTKITVTGWSEANGAGAQLDSADHTIKVEPLKVTTPKANNKTFPYSDAQSTTLDSTALKEFFDSTLHLQEDADGAIAVGKYYKLSGRPSNNASTYEITATLIDAKNTQWDGLNHSNPLTFTFNITARPLTDLKNAEASRPTWTYNGDTAKPTFALKDDQTNLTESVDYTLTCTEKFVKNDAVATATGMNNYTGTKVLYFDIKANDETDVLSVNANVYMTKNQSLDLREAILSEYPDIDVKKLTGLTFSLDTDDANTKTFAELTNGYTLRLKTISGTSLALGQSVKVKVSLPANTTYNVGGSADPEYTKLTLAETTITVNVASAVREVAVPKAPTNLVYKGPNAILVGVADGQYYNITSTDSGLASDGKETNANKDNEWYETTIALDHASVTDGTTLTWDDGTTAPKTIKWRIERAKIVDGYVTFTEIKADGYTLANVGLTGYFKAADGTWFEIVKSNTDPSATLKDNQAWLRWVAADTTVVVKDATYAWQLTTKGWSATAANNAANYEMAEGAVILYGLRAGEVEEEEEEEEEEEDEDDWETVVTNADGSVTVTKYDGETKVTTATTTNAYTTSTVTSRSGVTTSITATSSRAGASAYIPMSSGSVRWDTLVYVNGALEPDALPNANLTGVYVPVPYGTSSVSLVNDGYNYTDVSVGSWYGPSLYVVASRDLLGSTSDYYKTFSPTMTLTNGHTTTMLARYSGAVALSQSTGKTWYVPGMSWAMSTGVAASNNHNANTSREEMALMLYNYYTKVLRGSAQTSTVALSLFSDYTSIGSDARVAVAWCVANGIIEGDTNTLNQRVFRPDDNILRQEAVCMIARFMYVVNGYSIPASIA